MPAGQVAINTLEGHPERASDEEKVAIKFLLTIALPSVEKDLSCTLKWQTGMSTKGILGIRWHHSVALASVLMDHYSTLDNVEENIKAKERDDDTITDEPLGPVTKKRKKMVSKGDKATTICDKYYQCSHKLWCLSASEGDYQDILLLWDKESGRIIKVSKGLASAHASIQPSNQ